MKIGAVLLAAGASRRFGTDNKLLADIGGVPLVTRVAAAIAAAGIAETVAVTGHDRAAIEAALDGCALELVHNPGWERGMGTSIAAGTTALGEQIEGAFIVPGDLPFIPASLLARLAETFEAERGEKIVYPVTPDGAQCNPVLWPRRFFALLAKLDAAEGGKSLLAKLAKECVALPVRDAALFADLDTPEELALARAKAAQSD